MAKRRTRRAVPRLIRDAEEFETLSDDEYWRQEIRNGRLILTVWTSEAVDPDCPLCKDDACVQRVTYDTLTDEQYETHGCSSELN